MRSRTLPGASLLGGPVRRLVRGPVEGSVPVRIRCRVTVLVRVRPLVVGLVWIRPFVVGLMRVRPFVVGLMWIRSRVAGLMLGWVSGVGQMRVPGGPLPALRCLVLAGVVRAVRLGAGAPAQVAPRSGGVGGRLGPPGQLGPDE
ncbi:hypothetical protein ABB07_28525 [Streptomyces incarnatus]|uniref:Uncharacterized protein n=1 Tax=Streptomyces incarnatus TaxID=665007 RepID=A0ABM5TS10_9ACTN|nr:hypothetical protein ABB07_28525 [Streptomyces incarnatus]